MITNLKQKFRDLQIMMRFAAFGATTTIALLGAAAVSPHISASKLILLLVVALLWHGFVHIVNDLIDYDIDRTQAVRVDSPLVQGRFSKRITVMLALAELGGCIVLSLLAENRGLALLLISLSIGCMTIYNMWGKRARMPLLTDLIQGVGWGAISLFGGAFAFGYLSHLSVVLFLFFMVDTLMISGIHANLRDLSNDLRHGVLTMVIWLGARPAEHGQHGKHGTLILPRRLIIYVTLVQLLLIGLVVYIVVLNPFRYEGLSLIVTLIIVGLLIAFTIYLGLKTLSATRIEYEMMLNTGLLHLLMILATLIGVFAVSLGIGLLTVLVCGFTVPLLTSNLIPEPVGQSSQPAS
jgi:4-hydroxybenzoate polyprenyltransferase